LEAGNSKRRLHQKPNLCHHVLLGNQLVITINVNQVESLDEMVPNRKQYREEQK
jgi:hypothetical protein